MSNTLINYLSFWNLKEAPFDKEFKNKFFYMSGQHQYAYETMADTIVDDDADIFLLTGETGTGKSFLVSIARESMKNLYRDFVMREYNEDRELIVVAQQFLVSFEHVMQKITSDLVEQMTGKKTKYGTLSENLYQFEEKVLKVPSKKKSLLLIVDEAQNCDERQLDEIRTLTNINQSGKLFTLVLVGQTELNAKVQAMPQLESRVSAHYHLNNLNRNDMEKYIRHRLLQAGYPENDPLPFGKTVINEIYKYSGGMPRKINKACKELLQKSADKQIRNITVTFTREEIKTLKTPFGGEQIELQVEA